ncbi:MAG: MerR family DNA-binding transcriptional regulator, partial [Peptostreptococcaceae bacterium]
MKKYFSIGEMSKLQNISIETLRHYDRLGLLNAEYINEKTGYRYYST